MPWRGYNFEDAILVSEKLVKEDYFTSIHIEEFEIEARDTKLGPEEITRDIPNVSEAALKDLDESGHHPHRRDRQGGRHPGRQGHAEGRDAADAGREAAARHLRREGRRRPRRLAQGAAGHRGHDRRRQDLLPQGRREGPPRQGDREPTRSRGSRRTSRTRSGSSPRSATRRSATCCVGQMVTAAVKSPHRREAAREGRAASRARRCERLTRQEILRLPLDEKRLIDAVEIVYRKTDSHIEVLHRVNEERIELLQKGDELPPGVIKMVKVYVAMKRKLQVGDKMAGRHGNKGVISRILPEEDMPYLPDGTPVEIVLNPLGVPCRMNVGQILETHLGWAGKVLGLHFATPVFDGAPRRTCSDAARRGAAAALGQDAALRRHDRRAVRAAGDGGLHLHAEALPPGRRQDPRPLDRTVLAHHAAAARRQGAVRRPALRRDGSLGARGLRRRLHAAGAADRQVATTSKAAAGSTRRSSRARCRRSRVCPSRSTCSCASCRASVSTSSC